MNLTSFNDISYRDKKALLQQICAMQQRLAKLSGLVVARGQLAWELHDSQSGAQALNAHNPSLFTTLLSLLRPAHRQIIEREFLSESFAPRWYEDYWSKSAYYKLKHAAIDEFLLLFYV